MGNITCSPLISTHECDCAFYFQAEVVGPVNFCLFYSIALLQPSSLHPNANIIYARQYFIAAVKYFQSKQTTVLCSSHRKNLIQQTSVAVLYIKAHLLPVWLTVSQVNGIYTTYMLCIDITGANIENRISFCNLSFEAYVNGGRCLHCTIFPIWIAYMV